MATLLRPETAGEAGRRQAPLGWWIPEAGEPPGDPDLLPQALAAIGQPLAIVSREGRLAPCLRGRALLGVRATEHEALPLLGLVPSCRLEDLGDPSFRRDLGLRYNYLAGAMANGIASVALVEAVARGGMLGFFGAAGLSVERIDGALGQLRQALDRTGLNYGFNLIHSPNEPLQEAAVVELYLRRGVRLVEASAYLDLTLPLIRYRLAGIRRLADGRIEVPNRVIAKVSRVEVARKFLAPAPERFLRELIRLGELSEEQARWAAQVPVAQDLTAEADSGGHTDNRPAVTLVPTMLALRDQLQREHGYPFPLRVGAAGGVATPASTAALFALGAAWVQGGSVHQACLESGTSERVRAMLAEAQQADVTMAPAADMFEMGVRVQVLKRGTMFPMRAQKLYELFRAYGSLEALPQAERAQLEKNLFRAPLERIWAQTQAFFAQRDPGQLERAAREPGHKLALLFRWYLGLSSRWANEGEPDRQADYQIWCGPAMGAFNEWTRGSFLERPEARRVLVVALNLLYGCAVLTRVHGLRCQGVCLPDSVCPVRPLPLEALQRYAAQEGC